MNGGATRAPGSSRAPENEPSLHGLFTIAETAFPHEWMLTWTSDALGAAESTKRTQSSWFLHDSRPAFDGETRLGRSAGRRNKPKRQARRDRTCSTVADRASGPRCGDDCQALQPCVTLVDPPGPPTARDCMIAPH